LKRVLFCHAGRATFVEADLKILKEKYDFKEYVYTQEKNILKKLHNVITSFWMAFRFVQHVDIVYVWFGGYHGFFPILIGKIMKKKTIVIVGGYDASYIPSLPYGVFTTYGLLRWCVERMYRWADYLLTVDESLVQSTNYYADPTGEGYKTGILNHLKGLDKDKIKVIYLNVEDYYNPDIIREDKVISIAKVSDLNTFTLKGFDMVIEIARRLPHIAFEIVGLHQQVVDIVSKNKPENLTFNQAVTDIEKSNFFCSAKVILHPSMTEGFCAVIPEAMLCGCIPVGSNVGGISRSIGETGYVIDKVDIELYVDAILKAIDSPYEKSQMARSRIMELYPVGSRKEALLQILSKE
jgi:glycosyltransferase involved in cell wall biosynthesis